ncbi:phosphopantothenoylcysteine decarboxylase/phosphopantothenate--cysteine ligase [Salinibacter ruber]|uniref:Coenzyme A biosynthesis bifunctional protein CoaBC n=1 Tax=Salinibacter ruber TaxID=146919 RepID=A0A9X2Q2F9_9BACT|nr:bifunctional phosphopantothenoylcysteine decarboxylase/phosphopantothenate--cysteine ligase CoaBC [Salinibacter ruber]MCS3678383.1 phosphopantothenoylcysteine decarboxylase/phosphopantothenate--cysteine ligase [Salinibacter ruber]MCS3681670.1 phosphopantothenoylcysteine decarboxylase/phosphopantothenate--cysteine ligase [Salinibacter ruber]
MPTPLDLSGRCVVLGVTGSIAAYKAAPLVRHLKKAGAEVQVLMTPDAERFVTPLTLGTLSEKEVLTDIFPENEEGSWTKHVTLGQWGDLFVVAPATAQTVAKLAHGFCDSMLTATALSARCPLLVCPAMDRDMYQHAATQDNLERLREIGYEVMPAAHGELASGLVGQGRMPEPEAILKRVAEMLEETEAPGAPPGASQAGHDVLVTAGPTREPIDPARVLTNPSTGTMGYALAEAAAARGASVTLVTGPTALSPPPDVEVVSVETAEEMNEAVQARRTDADYVFMAAAVADYAPADPSTSKRKKTDDDRVLHLRRTPDILQTLGEHKQPGQVLVGFALETDDLLDNARRKRDEKNLDWVVVNDPTEDGAGFGASTNRVTLLRPDGATENLPRMPKAEVAEALLDRVLAARHEQST